jgi:murein DD-endopeptidase MepM/ murein hydrolase activator NlpD
MTRPTSRFAGVAGVLAALVVTGASGTAAAARPSRAAETASLTALADSLDGRLAALERDLGIAAEKRDPGSDVRERYDRLRAREAALARAAEAWLRLVPTGNPVDGGTVTSAFGPARFHPIRHRVQPHVGVDIAAVEGTPVRATADGVVHAVADNETYGRAVDVVHGRSGFITRVAHLRGIAVRPGQAVRRGEVLGWVGRTGLATGSHCHYEVFFRGRRRDPLDYLGTVPVADSTQSRFD